MSRGHRRPLVGISTYLEAIDRPPWVQQRSVVLPHGYVDQVQRCGGTPVLLPPREDLDAADAADVVASLDALIIAGGADVEPSRYGADPHPLVQPPRRDRDSSEIALVGAAIAADLPLLGICRGMQVMAVQAGGSLVQHLPDVVGHDRHSKAPGVYEPFAVRVAADSRLAGIVGVEPTVYHYHHQSVASHPGYTAVAWAQDGSLEAVEDPSARFCVGVQWHPEADGSDLRLIQALVDAARE